MSLQLVNGEQEVGIFSYTHKRIVFCDLTTFRERHLHPKFPVYYYGLNGSSQLQKRHLILPTDSEGVAWEICENYLYLL